jgi:very-short-patch-repair endonuclease
MGLAELFRLSARTGGPIHLATAAAAADVDVRTLRRHAAEQGWWRPYPGVAAPPGTPQTPWTRARAAAVYLGAAADPALLAVLTARGRTPATVGITGWTAAHLRGVHAAAPSRVQAVLPHGRRIEVRRHLEVRVSRSLHPEHIAWEHNLPLVTPARMLLDLARSCDVDRLLAMLIDLHHRGEVEPGEVERVLAVTRIPGRGVLRSALELLDDAGRTDSPFEVQTRRRLVDEHVPLDRGQVEVPTPVGPIHLDLGLQAIRFGIDTDGFGYHSSREQLAADAQRSNALARAEDDWRVLRMTWDDLHARWPRMLAEVREVIAAQSRRHLGLPWPLPHHVRA